MGLWRALICLLMVWVANPAYAAGPTFPELSGRVVDAANIIPDGLEAELTAELAALESKSSDQLVVATVPSLQGYEIEEFGYQLGRAWGLGTEKGDNGVILLVAPNERKVRIEVGYGLEGQLTDALSSRIVQGAIIPAFRAGDVPSGIVAGARAIAEVLTADPAELAARAKAAELAAEAESEIDPIVVIIILAFIIFWVFVVANAARSTRFGSSSGLGGVQDWSHTPRSRSSSSWGSSSSSWGGGSSWGSGGGGFSGGGGSFGGGGSSGSW
jgi:uncharacterized protein